MFATGFSDLPRTVASAREAQAPHRASPAALRPGTRHRCHRLRPSGAWRLL